jgi:hypothetical protein
VSHKLELTTKAISKAGRYAPRFYLGSFSSCFAAPSCSGFDSARQLRRKRPVFTKGYDCFNQNWNGSYFQKYTCDETIALDCEAYGKCSVECLTQDKCGKSLEEALLAPNRFVADSDCPFGCTQTFSTEGNDLGNLLNSGAWALAFSLFLDILVFIGGLTLALSPFLGVYRRIDCPTAG